MSLPVEHSTSSDTGTGGTDDVDLPSSYFAAIEFSEVLRENAVVVLKLDQSAYRTATTGYFHERQVNGNGP